MGPILLAECFLCGREDGQAAVCPACSADLPTWRAERACPCCALPVGSATVCGRCLRRPPQFDQSRALFDYAFPAMQLVRALKYGGRLDLARWLGECAAGLIADPAGWDAVIPVPLHADRLRERGFNQAGELARWVAATASIPLAAGGVRRSRATPSQAGLAARERRRNLKGAFELTGALPGRRIVVVDDVMTTGATLDELAGVLKRAGAEAILNLVVARTPGH
ncbi:MAG: ComF family protein [Rhodocyclaceae bacterium]|nr:ComF family protein [Rhodocyclaceae bacterium]